jgi:isopentenyl diphosphate isomerase/L-lactate dehydrogenase-like FMN-dependent dehydrogenase
VSSTARVVRSIRTVDDARNAARRRLPRMIFDFVDGGADGEVTLRANRTDFDELALVPRSLVDVSTRTRATTLFGQELSMPLLLAPAGLGGVVGGGGEVAAARAAAAAGTVLLLSTQSSATIESVAAAAPGAVWFQLYPWRDPNVVESLVARAMAAGCRVLCVTVDTPAVGKRVRDLHNGAVLPPRPTVRTVLDAALRPRWMRDVLLGPRLSFANLGGFAPDDRLSVIGEYVTKHLVDPSATWSVVARIRDLWPGPLVVKGVLTPRDAHRAFDHGADGIVVSNHGGRQLDGVPSSIKSLAAVTDVVGGRGPILMDGGVRTGGDVVKALAVGADACLIGRPYLWGLATAGEAGVTKVLDILADEIDRTLALVGQPDVAELDRSFVSIPNNWPLPGNHADDMHGLAAT